jgi:hypothetical protein
MASGSDLLGICRVANIEEGNLDAAGSSLQVSIVTKAKQMCEVHGMQVI